MKIIEAMKQVQDLNRKADDLAKKIKQHSAYNTMEGPTYTDEKTQTSAVSGWLQSRTDVLREALDLQFRIQKTNVVTKVSIETKSGTVVERTIAEWIHRRRKYAQLERVGWAALTEKHVEVGKMKTSSGELKEIKAILCYDPVRRDEMLDCLDSEPSRIDARLEVVNAVTDLVD